MSDFHGKLQNLEYGSTRIETDSDESLPVIDEPRLVILQQELGDLRRSTNF
jgi:hypothetical protein